MSSALRLVRDDDPGDPPAVDLLELWPQYMTAYGCSPATIRGRTGDLAALLRHAGVTDARKLTRDHVVGWLGRNLKPWSRQTYWKAAQKFSEWMRGFGHDPASDLTRGMPKPPTPEPVARPINDETIERLLVLKLSIRSHAYVRLALYQALRVHEIAKIRGEDFDLASGWLLVTGKGNASKPIPIHPEVRKLCDIMPEIGYWFPRERQPRPIERGLEHDHKRAPPTDSLVWGRRGPGCCAWTSTGPSSCTKSGLTVRQVAAQLGVSFGSVDEHLWKAGVTMRAEAPPRMDVDDDLIVQLRHEGLSWREISDTVGMTTSGVRTRHRKIRRNCNDRAATAL